MGCRQCSGLFFEVPATETPTDHEPNRVQQRSVYSIRHCQICWIPGSSAHGISHCGRTGRRLREDGSNQTSPAGPASYSASRIGRTPQRQFVFEVQTRRRTIYEGNSMGKSSASFTRSSSYEADLGSANAENGEPLFSSSGSTSTKLASTRVRFTSFWHIFKLIIFTSTLERTFRGSHLST